MNIMPVVWEHKGTSLDENHKLSWLSVYTYVLIYAV